MIVRRCKLGKVYWHPYSFSKIRDKWMIIFALYDSRWREWICEYEMAIWWVANEWIRVRVKEPSTETLLTRYVIFICPPIGLSKVLRDPCEDMPANKPLLCFAMVDLNQAPFIEDHAGLLPGLNCEKDVQALDDYDPVIRMHYDKVWSRILECMVERRCWDCGIISCFFAKAMHKVDISSAIERPVAPASVVRQLWVRKQVKLCTAIVPSVQTYENSSGSFGSKLFTLTFNSQKISVKMIDETLSKCWFSRCRDTSNANENSARCGGSLDTVI